MNPGIGKTSKRKNCRKWSNNYGWQSIAIRHSFNLLCRLPRRRHLGGFLFFIAQAAAGTGITLPVSIQVRRRLARQNGYICQTRPSLPAPPVYFDNRAHHQTMARRIGKTGFGN